MFSARKQRQTDAPGVTSRPVAPAKASTNIRRALTRAVRSPFCLPARAIAFVRRALHRAPINGQIVLSQAEVFVERLDRISEQGRTLAYLLQTCILRWDMMMFPQDRITPINASRAGPAASLRIRRTRRYHVGKLPARRGLPLGLALTMLAPGILLAGGFGAFQVYDSYVHNIVPPEALSINQPARGARIYDRNGELLYEFVDQSQGVRLPIKLADVSPAFLAATIATEDDTFYTNPGINSKGLARAAWENLSPYISSADDDGALEGSGGSSITQQLVKNVYIPPDQRYDRTVDRKLREASYALELTNRYDKDQILEWYVNQISYGGLYLGVEAASEGYFGHPAKDLTLAESAMLAGIPQSPARYDPLGRPSAAQGRRNEILDIIAKKGSVQIGEDTFFTPTAEDLEAAREAPLDVRTRSYPIEAPHFVLNHVAPELEAMFGSDALYRDGLVVKTSIDMNLQRRTNDILERWIEEFEATSNSRNGAVVIIDAHTGELLTVIGSRDYFRDDIAGNVDNLTALNSPGSTFKPFVYLTTFNKLGWTPKTIIADTPVSFRESNGTYFSPTNPNHGYMGNITIAQALGNSLNVPAFKAALALGVPAIINQAKQLGFTTLHGFYGPSIAIGGVDLNAMDLAFGYSVLANNGAMVGEDSAVPHDEGERTIDPISILHVEDQTGKVLYDVNDHREHVQVVPAEKAYEVTSILTDPSNECATFGCGGIAIPGHVAGVKTGTSEPFDPNGPNAGKIGETWAFGYTPDYVVGVWAGNSDNSPVVNILSTSISYRVMRDAMLAAYDGRPSEPFARPATLPPVQQQAAAPPLATPQVDPRAFANQAPQVSVSGASAYAGGISVSGSAVSGALQSYRVEVASGDGAWRAIGSGNSPVPGGVLANWPTSAVPAGTYSLRVVVQDAVQGAIISPILRISLR